MNFHESSTFISYGGHWPDSRPGDTLLSMGSLPPIPRLPSAVPPGLTPTSDDGAMAIRTQRGMTLVEILVVLVLVGLAALIAVTNLQTVQRRFELENTVRELTAFINEVPNYAKQQNAPVFLVWNQTTRRFSIATDAAAANVLDTFTIPKQLTIVGSGAPVLRCDVYGRTFVGTSTIMMTTSQTVSLTHSATPEASAPTYIFSLSPLWAITVVKA